MKRIEVVLIALFLLFNLMPNLAEAKFSFGMPSLVKEKAEKLDEKVTEKKQVKMKHMAVEARGCIRVDSRPQGAEIYLDGIDTGKTTPAALDNLSAGDHTVKLILTGYVDWLQIVSVVAGQIMNITASLQVDPVGPILFSDDFESGLGSWYEIFCYAEEGDVEVLPNEWGKLEISSEIYYSFSHSLYGQCCALEYDGGGQKWVKGSAEFLVLELSKYSTVILTFWSYADWENLPELDRPRVVLWHGTLGVEFTGHNIWTSSSSDNKKGWQKIVIDLSEYCDEDWAKTEDILLEFGWEVEEPASEGSAGPVILAIDDIELKGSQ